MAVLTLAESRSGCSSPSICDVVTIGAGVPYAWALASLPAGFAILLGAVLRFLGLAESSLRVCLCRLRSVLVERQIPGLLFFTKGSLFDGVEKKRSQSWTEETGTRVLIRK